MLELRCGVVHPVSGKRCPRLIALAWVDHGRARLANPQAVNREPGIFAAQRQIRLAVDNEKFWAQVENRHELPCPRGHTFTVKDATLKAPLLRAASKGEAAIWLADVL